MRMYEDNVVDVKGMYDFVLSPEGDAMHIKIIKGDFEGIEYRYGKVGFDPSQGDADERLTMAFEYDIITLPSNLDGDLPDEQFFAFENLLGDILVDVLEKDLEIKEKNENRNPNTETPVSE